MLRFLSTNRASPLCDIPDRPVLFTVKYSALSPSLTSRLGLSRGVLLSKEVIELKDFYLGIHNIADAHKFPTVMISVNRLKKRRSKFKVNSWMLDSGAFSTIFQHGCYPDSPESYALQIKRWLVCGQLNVAVSQDWMCEEFILARTGLTIADHQRLTIERFDALTKLVHTPQIMPVLQGYQPQDYVAHIEQYGDRLRCGQWVGVGSVCKRNKDPKAVEAVLLAIKQQRPDLRLHGFGMQLTGLQSGLIHELLHSADSMAWSYHARKKGRSCECVETAQDFWDKVHTRPIQKNLLALQFSENYGNVD